MKRLTLTFIAILFFAMLNASAQTTNPAPYCAAGYDDGSIVLPRYIVNVTLGKFTNTSGTTQYPGKHYVFYNNLTAPVFVKDSSYDLSIKFSNNTYHFILAYIDYNQDNDFNDAGEQVFMNANTGAFVNPRTGTIKIPTTAKTGKTRMRVMIFEDDTYTGNGAPCTADTLDWGETEDYTINISSPVGINEVHKASGFTFYPNPATDYIRFDEEFEGRTVIITDMQGRIILNGKITAQSCSLAGFIPGTYIVKIAGADAVHTQRLTIGR